MMADMGLYHRPLQDINAPLQRPTGYTDASIEDYITALLMMIEAARTSETLVYFYQSSRRYSPEDSHLRIHRRENLKS
jgi:hypothetical protein